MKYNPHKLRTMNFGPLRMATYRGVTVHRLIGGWEILGKKTTDPLEVDKIIDEAQGVIGKSIKQ